MVEFNPHVNGINHEELNRYLAMTPTERYEEFLVRDQAVTKYLEENNLELEIECEYFPMAE